MTLLIIIIRTIFFYFFILISFRIMGKREIGELSVSDLTISLLIAELVAISIENENESIWFTIMPIIVLVLLEIILAFIELKYNKTRKVIDGKPSIIIKNGKINIKEMIKQRYSLDDLLLALRAKGINGLNEVSYAILEINGTLSVFKKNKNSNDNYPLPIVFDGVIDEDALKVIKKDRVWLKYKCLEHGVGIKEILYAFYNNNVIYIIRK